METPEAKEMALALFRDQGGILTTTESLELGIHPRTLYALRDRGALQRLSRGLYRLADLPPLSHPDLVIVACRIPRAIICLVSALAFHGLTTQVPHTVDIALPGQTWRPRLDHPPLRVFRFSGPAWSEGVEVHELEGTRVRIYSPEKSLADAFKYRRKLGLDIALEVLRAYVERGDLRAEALLHYARICRVDEVMRPYLESLL